jgi:hypothetical protein
MAIEPVPDAGVAESKALRHATDRETLGDERLQRLALDTAARLMLGSVRGLEAVLLEPVGNRGAVLAGLSGDRLDRAAGLQS